jgi:hypothetical protein
MNERVLVAINKGSNEEEIKINLPEFYQLSNALDLFKDKKYEIKNSSFSFVIPPLSWKILKVE